MLLSKQSLANTALILLLNLFTMSHASREPQMLQEILQARQEREEQRQRAKLLQDVQEVHGFSSLSSAQKQQILKMAEKKIELEGGNQNRQLLQNGKIAELVLGGCNAEDVYEDTSYDDIYEPLCSCSPSLTYVQCDLGNQDCEGDSCTTTVEVFFFADQDGDLAEKWTCRLCESGDCDGFDEICTSVFFNDSFEPESCKLLGVATNATGEDTQTCDECQICGNGDEALPYGIQHTCFSQPTQGCDTESFAHLHNFLPTRIGESDVGGLFGQTCGTASMDRALYDSVQYQQGYSILCDCDDPTSGIITCDLHDPDCFANLCTDISDVFFFSQETGEYQSKLTLNNLSGLWTQTVFDTNRGVATDCSVLGVNLFTGGLERCDACQICATVQEGIGLAYDCFGQQAACDVSDGRAKYNFPFDGDNSAQVINNRGNGNNNRDALRIAVSICLGGVALAALIVVVFRERRTVASARGQSMIVEEDNQTVAETVAGDGEPVTGSPFTIDGEEEPNNDTNTATESGFMT